MDRYLDINGENLPSPNDEKWLQIEYVLQRYRDVWVITDSFPFIAVDMAKVASRSADFGAFAVFSSSARLMQNIRPEDGFRFFSSALLGGGIDAGLSRSAEVIVEGMANPSANWLMRFNDPLMIGMTPFGAFGTLYLFSDAPHIYQRTFGEDIIVDQHSRPSSQHVDFNPLANLLHRFHYEYISGPRDRTDFSGLSELLDSIFVENEKILTAATLHHYAMPPDDKAFNYVAPKLSHYGRLVHDSLRTPRIELSFALLHYEKALQEFDSVKVATAKNDLDRVFLHGVYCVVSVAACIEAIANKLVYLEMGTHPDKNYKPSEPLKKINKVVPILAERAGSVFLPLRPGNPAYDALDKVRLLRNTFMHAKEHAEEIDPVALTSTAFLDVDEDHCRAFLRQLRLGVAEIYDQLPEHNAPIVTRDNVKWFGDLEVP